MQDRIGERVLLEEPLGDEPLGQAWRGAALGTDGFRRAARIVRLRADLAQSEAFVEVMKIQGRALSERPHPGIEGLLDVARHGDDVYLVHDASDGPCLKEWVEAFHADGTPAPWGTLLAIAGNALCALRGLHERPHPLAHGSVDTKSVRLDRTGTTQLTRFGVATALAASGLDADDLAVQTPHGVATAMGDVFAVGLLLYTVLAGSSDSALLPDDLRARLMEGKPVDLKLIRDDVPPVVLGVVERALTNDSARQFDSALTMARALDLILRSRPETTDAGALARQIEEVLPAKRRPSKVPLGLTAAVTDQLDLEELQRLSIPEEESPPRE